MKLSELIEYVGNENVLVQRVDESLHCARVVDGATTLLEIETNAVSVPEMVAGSPRMHGIIVWMPRALMPSSPNQQSSAAGGEAAGRL